MVGLGPLEADVLDDDVAEAPVVVARGGVDLGDRLQDRQPLRRATPLFGDFLELLLGELAEGSDVVLVREDVHVDVQGELAEDRGGLAGRTGVAAATWGFVVVNIVAPGCDGDLFGASIVGTGILAIIFERVIVAAVEKVDEAGDAGFGVDGEVDDAFLGFLDSKYQFGILGNGGS